MNRIAFLLLSFIANVSFGQSVFINEIHYDNSGGDVNEGIEIAGPATTDLSTYSIILYNGSSTSMSVSKTEILSGVITDMQNGYGVINFPIPSIQNGAPDGIALVDGAAVIQFLSYEGSFTAVDGPAMGMTSIDIGVSETGSTPIGESLQLTGSGTAYENFIWNAPSIASAGSINPGQTFGFGGSIPSLSISSPTNNQEYNPETTTVDITFVTQNFDLTAGNFVEYVVNGGSILTVTTNTISIDVVNGETYNVTLELKDPSGSLSPQVIETVAFSVQSITNVSDIASMRDLDIGDFVTLTSEAILTFQQNTRSQKYIEDATGAILIDDSSGIVTTVYDVGDGITGITGQIKQFNGVLQLVPSVDPGTATSAANSITPQLVNFAELTANLDDYESEVVQVSGVTFSGLTEGEIYEEATNYTINDTADDLTLRTFNDVTIDYVGQVIPVDFINVIGIAGEFNGTSQILPRNLADIIIPPSNIPSLSITNPINDQEFSSETTDVDIVFTTNNFELTGGNFVEYIINGTSILTVTSNTITIPAVAGETYVVTLELKDTNGSLSPQVIETIAFSVMPMINVVSDIATLRDLNIGDFAMLTNEVILTFQQDTRNQKYIEDTTGAILIDDVNGIITTVYSVGDGIKGITGQVAESNDVLQFIPSDDPGIATSIANTITSQVVTFEDLTSNREAYESELVHVQEVIFTGITGVEVYEVTTNYTINDGVTDLVVTTFGDDTIDYIGQNISTEIISIIGLAGEFNGTSQISPRSLADLFSSTLSISDFNSNTNEFYIFPNPVEDGLITLKGAVEGMEIKIFNILGTQVKYQKLRNNSVDVSELSAGIYIVQLCKGNNKLTTKKLIINYLNNHKKHAHF